MEHNSIVFTLFLIFAGAGLFSTLALYMGQSLLIAYMLFGIAFGALGFKPFSEFSLLRRVDDIGIVFFMFLLGIQLKPQSLINMIGKTAWITLVSSLVFCCFGLAISLLYDYSLIES